MIIVCDCEAIYERTETTISSWLKKTAECEICGHGLESWSGFKLLSFKLLQNPTERGGRLHARPYHC